MGRQRVRQKVIHLACVSHQHLIIAIAIAFPEDDRLKDALHLAERCREEIQANLTFERQVAEKLATAMGYMDRCERSMRKALKYSTKLQYGSFHSTFL
jgi:hypothetical protein